MSSLVGNSPLRSTSTVSPKIELLAIVKTLIEFKGMLWGQSIRVYTDHVNLIRDALVMTLDRVYQWRLFLEEYGPKNVYIKGIHNTVAYAISQLEYFPNVNTLASHGLEELFLQLCCCVSFLFWWEIGFGFTYYLCT